MTSILKADTIQDTDGNNIINENSNTITIGASGDTTNIIGTLQNNGASVGGNTQPYFTAYQAGNYSIAHNTNVNLVLTSTTVNSGSAYSTSNGRFTPQVAGDYFCQFTFSGRHGSSGNAVVLFESHITKNGSVVFQASSGNEATSTVGQSVSSMSGIITFNGSSDYINAMVYQYDYTGNAAQNINEIQFSAFKMI